MNKKLIQTELPMESIRYGTSNVVFLLSMINKTATPLGIAILLLILGVPIFNKFESKKMSLLATLPVSRKTILLSDTLIYFGNSLIFILFFIFIFFLRGSLFGKSLPLDYPVLVTTSGITKLITAYEYLGLIVPVFTALSLFSFLLCYLLVLISKKTFLSVIITATLLFFLGSFSQSNMLIQYKVSVLNPFVYTQPSKIIIGEDQEEIMTLETTPLTSNENETNAEVIAENISYYAAQSLSKLNPDLNLFSGIISLTLFSLIIVVVNICLFKHLPI